MKKAIAAWKDVKTIDLIAKQGAIASYIKHPNDRALFEEAMRRLSDFSQLNTAGIKGTPDGSGHAEQILRLQSTLNFYRSAVQVLQSYNLADFEKPLAEWWKDVSANVRELKSKIKRLHVLIGEVYSMHFACKDILALEALPDDVRESVAAKLKDRKLRL